MCRKTLVQAAAVLVTSSLFNVVQADPSHSPITFAQNKTTASAPLDANISGPRVPLIAANISGPRVPLLAANISGPRVPLLAANISGPRVPLVAANISGPRVPLLAANISGPRVPLVQDLRNSIAA